jgi:hypothetical protein
MERITFLFILHTQDSGGIQFHIWTNQWIRHSSHCSPCVANFWSTFWGSWMRVLHRVVNVKPCIRLRLELQYCGAEFVSFYKAPVCKDKWTNANVVKLQWTGWLYKTLFTMERIIISGETCPVMAYVQMLYICMRIKRTKNIFFIGVSF